MASDMGNQRKLRNGKRNWDFRVVGVDADGGVICCDCKTGEYYNCGESVSQFGPSNMTALERELCGVKESDDGNEGRRGRRTKRR